MSLFEASLIPALDEDGVTLPGATWSFYASGTLTPVAVYADENLTVSLGNVVSANGAGRFPQIYYDDSTPTRAVLRSAAGTPIDRGDIDPINPGFSFLAANRTALAAMTAVAGQTAFLTEAGRQGTFIFRNGVAPSDPLQGLYVPHVTSGYWERVWDGVNGYTEWFGAVQNVGGDMFAASNLAAFHACLALCPVTQLRAGDYWISGTFKIDRPYRTVTGAMPSDGYGWPGNHTGTRILSRDGTKDVIQVGPDDAPGGGVNAFLRNIVVENLSARWDAPFLTLGAEGAEAGAPKCFNYKYLLGPQFNNLAAWEPQIGHYLHAVVTPKFTNCVAFRSFTYSADYDFFRGFWLRGDPQVLAGGNASVFLNGCNVSVGGGAPPNQIGFYCNANFADTYLFQCETSQLEQALVFDGGGAASNGQLDVHVIMPIFDQCKKIGIDLVNLNEIATVSIVGGYVQCRVEATEGLMVRGSGGSVVVTGGFQLLGSDGIGPSPGQTGIRASQQPNLVVDRSVTIKEFGYPVSIDGGSSDGVIEPTIWMSTRALAVRRAAVYVGTCHRMRIAPSVRARAGNPSFSEGVNFTDAGSTRCTVDATGISAAAVGTPVVINSATITEPGWYKSDGTAGAQLDHGIQVNGFIG